jgi:hypothetical protein
MVTSTVMLEAISFRVDEVLRSDVQKRSDISVPTGMLTLGKNGTTGIADSDLHRRVARIIHTEQPPHLEMVVELQSIGKVSVNGELVGRHIFLKNKDIVRLHASRLSYDYRVRLDSAPIHDNNVSAPISELSTTAVIMQQPISQQAPANEDAMTASKTSQPPPPSHLHAIAEEFHCALCLEIQVESTLLIPCGHAFCKGCVEKSEHCITCRQPITSTIPCRPINNAIAALVRLDPAHSAFEQNDIEHYKQRMVVIQKQKEEQLQQQQLLLYTTPSRKKQKSNMQIYHGNNYNNGSNNNNFAVWLG